MVMTHVHNSFLCLSMHMVLSTVREVKFEFHPLSMTINHIFPFVNIGYNEMYLEWKLQIAVTVFS
jgi:hypothetical protein